MIRMLIPNMLVEKTKDMILVRGIGPGGTTTLATGNAIRYDEISVCGSCFVCGGTT